MDKLTTAYALRVLDSQFNHMNIYNNDAQRDRQQAYYDGMRTMFEMILTAGYTDDGRYLTRVGGQHVVKTYLIECNP